MKRSELRQLIREQIEKCILEWSPEELDSPKYRAAWSVASDLEKKLKQPTNQTAPQKDVKELTAYLNVLVDRGPWYRDVADKMAEWAKRTNVPNVKQPFFSRWQRPSVASIIRKKNHPQYAVAVQMFATNLEKLLKDVPDRAWPGEKNPLAAKYGVDAHQPKSDKSKKSMPDVGQSIPTASMATKRKRPVSNYPGWFTPPTKPPSHEAMKKVSDALVKWQKSTRLTYISSDISRTATIHSILANSNHRLYDKALRMHKKKKHELEMKYGIATDIRDSHIVEAVPADFGMPAYTTTEKSPPRMPHGNTPMDKNIPNPEKEDAKVKGGLTKTTKIVKKNEKTNRIVSPNRRDNGSL